MRAKGKTRKKIAFKEEQGDILGRIGYLESIMSSMTDALIVVNPDGTLRSANRATLDLLGYKKDELIGQPLTKIFSKEEENKLHNYLHEIIVPGVPHNIALSFLTKQDKAIPVNFSSALLQHDGKITGIVGVARDLHRIIEIINDLEEKDKNYGRMQKAMLHIMDDLDLSKKEMETANIELRKLDLLKSDFVSTVSHELRTPLTVTREAISQVLDGVHGEINKEQKQFLLMSIGGIDRLSRLIENLLDISKIEAHKMRLKRDLIDIVSLAKEVGSSFAPALQAKSLEAQYNVGKHKIELYMDKDRITQVFVNLMSNALKFTPAGSIEISIVDKENVVECAVSDTGIGISDEDLPRVFGKFDQFGRESYSAEKGTGLGLAISKGIIELHRGQIWVESKLGRGTKISFALPKYSPRELFKEYVTNGLAEAIKEGAALAIIIFEFKYYEALQEKLGHYKFASIMHSLGQLIKAELRRKSDISIKDNRAIVVVLPETDRKGAWSTAERLNSCIASYLSKVGLAEEIEVDSRVAAFPEDAATEEELLNTIKF
jgi:PAS domain S-box-containing protein